MEQEEIPGKPKNEADWRAEYCALLLAQLAGKEQDRLSAWPEPSAPVYLPRTLLEERVQPESGPRREGNRPTSPGGEERARQIMIKVPVKEKELWKKLDSDRVLLLEAPARMGKTTWSIHLAQECMARPDHLPIWISFRDLVAEADSIENDVAWEEEASIRKYLIKKYDRSLGEQLYDQWGSSQAVLILDGLDEVVDPAQRVNALKNLLSTGASSQRPLTILTSRPLGHNLPLVTEKIELQGLSPQEQIALITLHQSEFKLSDQQIEQFLQRVGLRGTKAASSSPVQSLLERPGHLVAILRVYAKTGHVLETETEVFSHLLEERLTGRSESPADLAKKRQVLEGLALHLLACRQGQAQSRAQILGLVEQVLQEHDAADTPLFPLSQAPALLNDFVHNSGLLTRLGLEPERYQLESVVWLQYLAGGALADKQIVMALNLAETEIVNYLDKKVWDPEFEPVLKSWVGQADNPFPLFERLMDKTKDDLARHRLGTAGRCLFEVNPQLRDHEEYQTLSVQIPTEAFAVWKAEAKWETEHLCASSLRKAWMETEVGQSALMGSLRDKDVAVQEAAVLAFDGLWAGLSTAGQEALVSRFRDKDMVARLMAKMLAVSEAVGLREQDGAAWLAASKRFRLDAAQSVAGQAALLTWLWDSEWYGRLAAVKMLGAVGVELSAEARAALVKQLRDQDKRVRQAAVGALSGLGAGLSAEEKVALVERLADWDTTVRWMAAAAIKSWGMGLPVAAETVLLKQLRDQDKQVRQMAVEVLSGLGAGLSVGGEAALVVVLQDEEEVEEVRQAAIWALGGLGTELSTVGREALVAGLQDQDQEVRQVADWILGRLEAGLSTVGQEALVAGLQDESLHVRCLAAKALGRLGATGQEALVERLQDQDQEVRGLAAWVLGGLGAGLSIVGQEALVASLQDEDPHVRKMVVLALGELALIAELSTAGQEALVARLRDQDQEVRQVTARVLGTLGAAGQEALVAGLQDENLHVRRSVAQMLDRLRPGLSTAGKEVLVGKLRDQDQEVRQVAAQMLGKLGVLGQEALVAGLQDENLHVRRSAAQALNRLWAELSTAGQEALVGRLRDQDQEVRQVAVRACTFAQQGGLRFFPACGRGGDWFVKRLVAKVLGRFGMGRPSPVVMISRLVSVLSATVPFSDACSALPRRRVSPVVTL